MIGDDERAFIASEVHHLYYDEDENCARTTLRCLSRLFSIPLGDDVLSAATGMHGASYYGAQCGLVEGTLMFIGLYGAALGKNRADVEKLCNAFAAAFEKNFSSLRCSELRPGGFNADDPPHLCLPLTVRSIEFSYIYIKNSWISQL